MPIARLRAFFQLEVAGGILLMAAAALAILANNSPLAGLYDKLLTIPFTIALGEAALSKPLLLWINDGLMVIFFLLVGLELKRELLEGHLAGREQAVLPLVAALGGMAVPALVFLAFTYRDPVLVHGWAIPAATDIAFALGVMMLLGDRVPLSLKVLLTSIAVIDDLGAIAIIAVFYTAELSTASLLLAALALAGLYALNRRGVVAITPYMVVGVLLWVCVLKSGVHATLAGVAIAFAIPLRARNSFGVSPARALEQTLHPWVAYGILPLFAFANAGLPLAGLSLHDVVASLPLGIALGLFLGKPVGVLAGILVARTVLGARLPVGAGWSALVGMAILTGIGFTMSLFIGSLAFDGAAAANAVRLGVLMGSLASALAGVLVLRAAAGRAAAQPRSAVK